jgi:ATP-dependent DNA ligase
MLRGHHPMCFIAFDLLWLNGEDLRELPLVERKRRLKRQLARRSNP